MSELIRYRKIGGGSLRMKGRPPIKPNQVVRLRPSEIPEAFKDSLVPLEEEPAVFKGPVPVIPRYEVVPRGGGWYDIVNINTGKQMNEAALRRQAADSLLDVLHG